LKILYFADIVGRPGRGMIKYHIEKIKNKFDIDFVVANVENASHGFGVTKKNAKELFNSGINLMTGGNHSWDKKEIVEMMKDFPILRPLNYPEVAPGNGEMILEVCGEKLAVLNLMGYYGMPMVDNPFTMIKKSINKLEKEGIKNIFIDFHAEATSEKNALFAMLKDRVSVIVGSHTHIGTDDLTIDNGTFYVTDVGLTGCRDGVIGMDIQEPKERFLTSISSKFDIPKQCKKILQAVVVDIKNGKVVDAFKIKAYDEGDIFVSQRAYYE
jgi:metallophosphoesterase (TIGR00282 family)